jgi:hypothetical protein
MNIDGPSRTFSGTSPASPVSYNIQVIATDIDGYSVGTFMLKVETNPHPIYHGGLQYQVWTSGLPYYYQFGETVFTDPEGGPLTYEVYYNDGSDLPGWIHFDSDTRTYSGIAGPFQRLWLITSPRLKLFLSEITSPW